MVDQKMTLLVAGKKSERELQRIGITTGIQHPSSSVSCVAIMLLKACFCMLHQKADYNMFNK